MTSWIFKILRGPEWAEADNNADYRGSPADQQDGFIHFSTLDQLEGTLSKHFTDIDTCYLMVFHAADFAKGTMKWEPSRGGQLFPHLYAPLGVSIAKKTWKLDRKATGVFDLSSVQQWIQAND